MLRRVNQAGGNGAILARGDDTAGAILIVCRNRGVLTMILERVLQGDGYAWTRVGPSFDDGALGQTQHDSFDDSSESRAAAWLEKRGSRDPDLWAIELDIPHAERFAAEILAAG